MSQTPTVQTPPNAYAFQIDGPLIELSPRWVRVKAGEVLLADSRHTLLLREYGPGRLPTYYFPAKT